MKLFYYQNQSTSINFGDTLNDWLWPKILGDFLDQDEAELFVGFGTMLNERLPKDKILNIFSTGYGYNTETIKPGQNWRIHCVRGPLTAKALGIKQEYSIADGAILTADHISRSRTPKYRYGYMPHFVNSSERWRKVTEQLDIKFIDPTQSVEDTLRDISETEILLAEAMHGAIIADCLGIPWVPIKSSKIINTFKWQDYCQSMGIEYQPRHLPPMSATVNPKMVSKVRGILKYRWVHQELRKVCRMAKPCLSPRDMMTERQIQLKERLDSLKDERRP